MLSIPTLRKIRERYPADDLILVTRPKLGDFFRQHGLATHIFELQKNSRKSLKELRQFLRGFEITEIVCPHQSFRSAWILKDIYAAKKIAYKNFWNFPFFNMRIEREMAWPEVLRVSQLFAAIDENYDGQLKKWRSQKLFMNINQRTTIDDWGYQIPKELSMYVTPRANDIALVMERLSIQRPFVVLAPSSQWVTKKWTPEGYSELIRSLRQKGFHCYVVGSPQEKTQCDEVVNLVSNQLSSGPEVRSLAGETSLIELHALLSVANYAVTNDSGPMHMAAAAGCPVVALFGPTTLDLGYRPWANNAHVVQVDIKCRPCGKHGHNRCPIGTHDCMKMIDAKNVESIIFQKS